METTQNTDNNTLSFHELSETMMAHFEEQIALCLILETIADTLPDQFDPQICLRAAHSIYPIIKSAHDFEENILFPELKKNSDEHDKFATIFDRLHAEHWEDESFGEEVSEALKELVQGRQDNPEKLGYMLRGFFEGIRRHIAFENEHLLPIIKNTIKPL